MEIFIYIYLVNFLIFFFHIYKKNYCPDRSGNLVWGNLDEKTRRNLLTCVSNLIKPSSSSSSSSSFVDNDDECIENANIAANVLYSLGGDLFFY